MTNRYGLRAGLRIAQPSGAFAVTYAWDAAGRWSVVGGTAGTFTYSYPASYAGGPARTLPTALTLPGGGYLTNTYDTLARLTRTEWRTSAGALLFGQPNGRTARRRPGLGSHRGGDRRPR